MKDSFFGTVVIDGNQYPFLFENYRLMIDAELLMAVDVGDKPWNCINGKMFNEPATIVFYLGPIVSTSIKSGGFSSTTITIRVLYYVLLKDEFFGKTMLKFKNKEFAKWLGILPQHDGKITDSMFEDRIELKRELKDQMIHVEYQDNLIESELKETI